MEKKTLKTETAEKVDKLTKQVEEKKQTDAEYMKEFVESKDNQDKARGLAEQIEEHVSRNWFDIHRMQRKTGSDQKDCMNKLAILSKFNLCISRRGAKGPEYKITFSTDDVLKSLDKQIANVELSLKMLQNKRRDIVERNNAEADKSKLRVVKSPRAKGATKGAKAKSKTTK